ncbi:Methyltransferase domain-containing protein [Plasmodiophora brassicae]
MATAEVQLEMVKNYYGKTLSSSDDLKTTACCTASAPHPAIREALRHVPDEVIRKYYGCGSPTPMGIEGSHGLGSGRDCYVAAFLVGKEGSVIGIDMTEEQIEVARSNIAEFAANIQYAPNVRFALGFIEDIRGAGVADESIDIVISNCVVNLSPAKDAVLKGVYQCLKPGGEFYFSDVYCDRRLPDSVRRDEILLGECLGGALYVNDFIRLAKQAGFADPRVLSKAPINVTDPALKEKLGLANFYSITFRLFKLDNLETLCEDYGQIAVYKGTIPGHTHSYALDDHHVLESGKPLLEVLRLWLADTHGYRSGSGRDCYVAAFLVGKEGSVVGIDMTEEQIEVARSNIAEFAANIQYAPNLRFALGFIEDIRDAGVADESIDIVISNCVVNLSPAKDAVLKGKRLCVYQCLIPGGEFYFSDLYCDRRLPDSVRRDEVLLGEGLGGALYVNDFIRLAKQAGFADPRVLSKTPINVTDPALKEKLGLANFYSITFRLFKLDNLETLCEDYGQIAIYKGTIPGHTHSYALDDHHVLESGKPLLVCGNTASMLSESWLAPHFTIMGGRSTHFGTFECAGPSLKSPGRPGTCC